MKRLRLILLVVAAGLLTGCLPSMKTRVQSGSLTVLKHERQINLEYEYDGLKVGRKVGKWMPEQEFIDQEVAMRNQKSPGQGEAWRAEWINQRLIRLEPKFQQLINKQFAMEDAPLVFGPFKDARYTLVLKTRTMVPGTRRFFSYTPPYISADAVFVETQNRANNVAEVSLVNAKGEKDFAVGSYFDLAESYAKAGKDLGILIRKKIK